MTRSDDATRNDRASKDAGFVARRRGRRRSLGSCARARAGVARAHVARGGECASVAQHPRTKNQAFLSPPPDRISESQSKKSGGYIKETTLLSVCVFSVCKRCFPKIGYYSVQRTRLVLSGRSSARDHLRAHAASERRVAPSFARSASSSCVSPSPRRSRRPIARGFFARASRSTRARAPRVCASEKKTLTPSPRPPTSPPDSPPPLPIPIFRGR
jgi:hypothetical protein